eukprot:4020269-Ditylum_brightwellii.AAC.1
MYKLCTTSADATLPIYKLSVVLKGQNVTQGPASYVVVKTLLKGNAFTVSKQVEIDYSNLTIPHFELCLDDVAAHIFSKKSGQAQKYLKDFPVHNRNSIQPLDNNKLLDILEYGVTVSWHREFTVQGFDQVDQGLQKFVQFCTRLELCEPSADKPKGEKTLRLKMQGNIRLMILCLLSLQWRAKRAKPIMSQNEADK